MEMGTALQIALLLILIALIGILLGYLFGRITCKKREQSLYFEKSDYCEDSYNQSLSTDESIETTNTQYNSSVAGVTAHNALVTTEQPESDSEDTGADTDEMVVDDTYKPALLSEPKGGVKDNLCRIKGIGVVIEEKLNNLGVYHFEQIAAWTDKEVAWIDSHLAFSGRILREDWIGQAKLLATGAETEFSKRVDKGEVATSKKD